MATTILGIDAALRHTGVARWRDGKLSTFTINSDPSWPDEKTIRWVAAHIWPLVTAQTFAVIEEPFVGPNPMGALRLAGLHYHLRIGFWSRDVPFATVHPSTLKKWGAGNGRSSKDEMIAAARNTFGPAAKLPMGAWKPLGDEEHEADALAALHLGLYHRRFCSDERSEPMRPGVSDAQHGAYLDVAAEWPFLEWPP